MKKIIKTIVSCFTKVKQEFKSMSSLYKSKTKLMTEANKEFSREHFKNENSKYTIIM